MYMYMYCTPYGNFIPGTYPGAVQQYYVLSSSYRCLSIATLSKYIHTTCCVMPWLHISNYSKNIRIRSMWHVYVSACSVTLWQGNAILSVLLHCLEIQFHSVLRGGGDLDTILGSTQGLSFTVYVHSHCITTFLSWPIKRQKLDL